ncbi:MAG: sulfurtransferase [Chloroflexota bacterium]|nr:sulfurtransferase [Chloroflexota bacterium]
MSYPLVTTDWLTQRIDDRNIRIVDIRGHVLPASAPLPHYYNHHADYLEAHIPGAVFIDWVHEITDPADPRHAQIAPPERYAAVMRRNGVSDDTFVVAYDDAGGMFAARLWWSLLYYGHEHAAVLIDGWQRWVAQGLPTDSTIPNYPEGSFQARPQPHLRLTAEDVLAGVGHLNLLDVRTPDEFAGSASRTSRKGHIPTALNLPRAELLDAQGVMLAPDLLRAKFEAAGVHDDGSNTVTYCNGGVSASFALLAMRAAGYKGGAVYDGSWKDWSSDPDKPVESEQPTISQP